MKNEEKYKLLIDCFIEANPIQTFEDLKTKSGWKSITLYRKIKACNLLVSYNQNAKFYTLSKLAHFNHNGIWNYKQILFSKHGNLFNTIIALINNCIKGYTAKEMTTIMEVKTDDALRVLWISKRVHKQKIGSTNVYFSTNPEFFAQQLLIREQENPLPLSSYILSDYQIIIAVLVEIIQKDSLDYKVLLKGVKKQNVDITIEQIEQVIDQYKLKKKTNK
jgi:hypothetical protein